MTEQGVDEFRRQIGRGAHSVDIIVLEANDWMTVRQIEEEVLRRRLPTRGAVREHLDHLVRQGFLRKEKRGRSAFYRVPHAVGSQERPPAEQSNEPLISVMSYVPDELDSRFTSIGNVPVRSGQGAFRETLIRFYGCQCQVTGTRALSVLEAAHICGYLGTKDDHPENGLILRCDIHELFDQRLIGINPESLIVRVSESIKADYKEIDQKKLRLGKQVLRPSKAALQIKWDLFISQNRS